MSVAVTFNGTSYSIPQAGEEGWGGLTAYLVALSSASSSQAMQQAIRTVTTNYNVASTDFAIYVNAGSATLISLPQGSTTGRILYIADKSGAAATNPITVQATTSPAQVIELVNTYVIKSNYGGIFIQWNGTFWQIIAEYSGAVTTANKSFVSGKTNPITQSNVTDGQACTVTLPTGLIEFTVETGTGKAFHCITSYNSSGITAVSDVDNIFLTSDAGTGIYIYKSGTSGLINIKSRLGLSTTINVMFVNCVVLSTTAWS